MKLTEIILESKQPTYKWLTTSELVHLMHTYKFAMTAEAEGEVIAMLTDVPANAPEEKIRDIVKLIVENDDNVSKLMSWMRNPSFHDAESVVRYTKLYFMHGGGSYYLKNDRYRIRLLTLVEWCELNIQYDIEEENDFEENDK